MPQRASQRRWYEANRERLIAEAVAHQSANREEYLAYQRQNRLDNLEARREQSRQWRLKNGDKHRADSRRYALEHKQEISEKLKKSRREIKQTIVDGYGGACACCGERALEFLTIDHVNGDGADHRRSLGTKQSRVLYLALIAQGFPAGFRVLCFNCNSALGFYGYCPHRPEDIRVVNRGTSRRLQLGDPSAEFLNLEEQLPDGAVEEAGVFCEIHKPALGHDPGPFQVGSIVLHECIERRLNEI